MVWASVAVPDEAEPLQPPPLARPPALPDVILDELRRRLVAGRYAPGDRIAADAIAAELDVSAIPVREALRVLLAEGRVEYVPHRGYRVTRLSFDEIEEIFLILRLLEAEALRRGVPAMSHAAVRRMRGLLQQLEAPLPEAGADAIRALVAAHRAFHFVPMECADVPRLVAEVGRMWDTTAHYRTLCVFADDATYRAAYAEHRAILQACAARDVERVVALTDRHREHVLARMRHVVPRRAEAG
jgi:DNA-binding GntR family transcriptional regulator